MPISVALQKFIDDSIAAPDTWNIRGPTKIMGQERLGCVVIHPGGSLSFWSTTATSISVNTIIILPGGTIEMRPASPDVKHEIVFRDTPFDDMLDHAHFGHGLICLGTCLIAGSPKVPWQRAAHAVTTGRSHLPFAIPAGWCVGDKLIFPDTRLLAENERFSNYSPKWQVVQLDNDGNFSPSLDSGHESRTTDGKTYHPHIGNLSRNVVIRSENAHGNRGYAYFRDNAEVDIANCEFESLGRSQIGDGGAGWRYPVQFLSLRTHAKFNDNSVWCALDPHDCRFKWPLTIHDTHHSEFKRNVIHNWAGAGVALTNGNEAGNVIEGNLVTGTRGYSNPRNNDGDDGSAFWSVGWLSKFRGNIAAGAASYHQGVVAGSGFNLFSKHVGMEVWPQNEDFTGSTKVQMRQTPIAEFSHNEAYGCATGLTIWNLGTDGYEAFTINESVIRRFTAWNCHGEFFYAYPVHRLTFEDCAAIYCGNAFESGDYWASDVTLRRCKILGCNNGVVGTNRSGLFLLDDCDFQVNETGVAIQTRATPGTMAWCPPLTTRLVNCWHGAMPGKKLTSVATSFWLGSGTQLFQTNAIEVRNHQRVAGDDFNVYFPQSAATFVIPTHPTRDEVSHLVGMTNVQAWFAYHKAVAGVVAPVGTPTRADIGGLVEELRTDPEPEPEPYPNRPPIVDAGPDQTITAPKSKVQLRGTVSDDGFPTDAVVTTGWAQISGETCIIDTPELQDTEVSFLAPGEYVLRLLASDGELTASDTVTITVLPEPTPESETVAVPLAELTVVRGMLDALVEKVTRW